MYNKYKNKKTVTSDGIKHDSKKEAARWVELQLLERSGEITELRRQVEYPLLPPQYESYKRFSKDGKPLKDGIRLIERGVSYVADFVYKDKDGNLVVEDTKSPATRTKEYILKRKMVLYFKGIQIVEI